jgi:lysophospholipase L1-like esterase
MRTLVNATCPVVLCVILAGCTCLPWRESESARKPKVLIVGDSISMAQLGFFNGLIDRAGDQFDIVHNPDNASNSGNVAKNIRYWVESASPDIIHLNCGLHDIKYDRKKKALAIAPDQYEQNLRTIAEYLNSLPDKTIIFALTTPVIDEWHHANKPFDRREDDVQRYNAIARRVMAEHGIAVSDLHQVIADAGPESCLLPDGVHMNGKGNRLLAVAVAASLTQMQGME